MGRWPTFLLLPLALAAAVSGCGPKGEEANDDRGLAQASQATEDEPAVADARAEAGRTVIPSFQQDPAAFQAALLREIPDVLGQVGCYCGCDQSVKGCFEGHCPVTCQICNEIGQIAYEMHQQGATIQEIEARVDRAYGHYAH